MSYFKFSRCISPEGRSTAIRAMLYCPTIDGDDPDITNQLFLSCLVPPSMDDATADLKGRRISLLTCGPDLVTKAEVDERTTM